MSFKFLNEGQKGNIQEFTPIDTFIDPVSKIRVSNPSNLIDTDFEYGLQPTKWETVELINNTPAFFSKGGDTTISDITGIITNAGTREITVTTAFPHNLESGIPIRVSGTKSVTADGSYIINATPTENSFTYLCRANQPRTVSIFDLYSSIITGEFFQGSQIKISDAEGITTDGSGPNSVLTVKTENEHGFGLNTPFYLINLNSTISQEFESQNLSFVSFDPSNSATERQFDGSNTLLQTPIDISNSATNSNFANSIISSDPEKDTFTININDSDIFNWSILKYGDPLYYSVSAGGGYFQTNPRGVLFIKEVDEVDAASKIATFQVSQVPDGEPIQLISGITGFFQIANQAKTFAGNNVNENTQIIFDIETGEDFVFDGGNRGYEGSPEQPLSNVGSLVGYNNQIVTIRNLEEPLDYYVGTMLQYTVTESEPGAGDAQAAGGLVNNRTYFVTSFEDQGSNVYEMRIAEFPNQPNITITTNGSGIQQFKKIGVSVDKDVVHVRDSNFQIGDMIEYTYPEDPSGGNFKADVNKNFYFVKVAFDAHNYQLNPTFESFISAIGGNSISTITHNNVPYTLHRFNQPGTYTFSITNTGTFSQKVRFVTVNGTFDGVSSVGSEIDPAVRNYTVVVNSGGDVNIAYPQNSSPNNIPYSVIRPIPISATGGTISTQTISGVTFRLHRFTATGNSTFSVSNLGNIVGSNTVQYAVLAGGGGGGRNAGGGGGSGGVRTGSSTISATNYTVTVGAGAVGQNSTTIRNGGNSAVFGITSTGGGGGRGGTGNGNGGNGGSGGGGGGTGNSNSSGGTGISGQGRNGGGGRGASNASRGGGGGGFSTVGATATASAVGNGGNGWDSGNWGLGVIAGGGGGGGEAGGQGSGRDGGGNGVGTSANGGNATRISSGGGGAGGATTTLRNGGSGFRGEVLIRYRIS